MQGLTTSLIDRAYHARLFTSVAVLEILAKLIGGPIMGKLLSISKRGNQGSQGVCFSVSAVSQSIETTAQLLTKTNVWLQIILFLLMIMAFVQRLKRP